MYLKIKSDLENLDFRDSYNSKKIFGKISNTIALFRKNKDSVGLKAIERALNDFLSANKSRFDIERQKNPGSTYKLKLFFGQIDLLIKASQKPL